MARVNESRAEIDRGTGAIRLLGLTISFYQRSILWLTIPWLVACRKVKSRARDYPGRPKSRCVKLARSFTKSNLQRFTFFIKRSFLSSRKTTIHNVKCPMTTTKKALFCPFAIALSLRQSCFFFLFFFFFYFVVDVVLSFTIAVYRSPRFYKFVSTSEQKYFETLLCQAMKRLWGYADTGQAIIQRRVCGKNSTPYR
jgi:hypothetical protein